MTEPNVIVPRTFWKPIAIFAMGGMLSAFGVAYNVGRNVVNKPDLDARDAQLKVYIDTQIAAMRESQSEQKRTLDNIQGQIGSVRESQGRIDGKLDVLTPLIQDMQKGAR